MIMLYRTFSILVVLVSLVLNTEQSNAAPAVAFVNSVIPGNEGSNPGAVRGWVFDVLPASGAVVSHLGVYDRDADGLGESHNIGVWDSAGTLVISNTVPAGIAAPLDQNSLFRLVDVPDFMLPQATGYVIGAYYSHLVDGFDTQVGGLITHSSIDYVGSRHSLGVSELQLPTGPWFQVPGYFGPSFEIIPEPASITLLLLATTMFLKRHH